MLCFVLINSVLLNLFFFFFFLAVILVSDFVTWVIEHLYLIIS